MEASTAATTASVHASAASGVTASMLGKRWQRNQDKGDDSGQKSL
jgi:hypothetical protein